MIDTLNWSEIVRHIELSTQQNFHLTDVQSVSGGCINNCYALQGKQSNYFVKTNQANLSAMFEAEYLGLQEMAETKTVTVPTPIVYGISGHDAFLVLAYFEFAASNQQSATQLGQQLAALHKIPQASFGWQQNNTIGSTPQINAPSDHWITFWQENRLGYQLSLAESNGYAGHLINSGQKLLADLNLFFDGYTPHPSLLHGDLWSGNASTTAQGEAIIYDPACYYGDREADIAMTELFGGFGSHFYAAYTESYPLHSDYPTRKKLYNLYHILNHLNLFGDSYRQQAQNMIDSLLTEIS